jgi:hypothetical protein
MTLKHEEELIRLQRIVNLRLLFSIRWQNVKVFADNGQVHVYWHNPKGTQWESHTKSCSVSHLTKYTRSQEQKLMSEFKNRHDRKELKP